MKTSPSWPQQLGFFGFQVTENPSQTGCYWSINVHENSNKNWFPHVLPFNAHQKKNGTWTFMPLFTSYHNPAFQEIQHRCGRNTASGFPGGSVVNNPSASAGEIRDIGLNPWVAKIPLEEGLATHSSILTWEITWTEGPGELQSIGSQKLDVTEHTHTRKTQSQWASEANRHFTGAKGLVKFSDMAWPLSPWASNA